MTKTEKEVLSAEEDTHVVELGGIGMNCPECGVT